MIPKQQLKTIAINVVGILVILGCLTAVVLVPGRYRRKPLFDAPEWLQWYCLGSVTILVLFLIAHAVAGVRYKPEHLIVYAIIPVSLLVIWIGYYLKNGSWGLF